MRWSWRIHGLIGVPVEKHVHSVTSPGRVVGRVGEDIACHADLAEGTLLYLGTHDQSCSTLGEGIVRGSDCVMVVGIFGPCYVIMSEPLRDPTWELVVKPNYSMGNWIIEAFLSASASSLR